ncbi:hypothetical protein V2J09_002152 [Rumex salicifolius]
MGAGRKNLKREVEEESIAFDEGQTVMQVVSLRGSNIIEVRQTSIENYESCPTLVMDAKGEKLLAYFPAKFQKIMWVKNGSFVVIDESGREEAQKSGSKVACIVSRVLFYEQARQLQKSEQWPEVFKSGESSSKSVEELAPVQDSDDDNSSDDDGLPPLESNTNRTMPFELYASSESDSDTNP